MYSSLLLQFRKLSHLRTFVAMQEMSRFTRFGSQKKTVNLGFRAKKTEFPALAGLEILYILGTPFRAKKNSGAKKNKKKEMKRGERERKEKRGEKRNQRGDEKSK